MIRLLSEETEDVQDVEIWAGPVVLEGTLAVPEAARGLILFAHGSGSSRLSPRNRLVARRLREAGMATLLFDLITKPEEAADFASGQYRFDIGLLATRLVACTDWVHRSPTTGRLRVGYFGSSTGAGAALVAAAQRPETVKAVVARGGRPDMAADSLALLQAPTLLIVGGDDVPIIELNEEAMTHMNAQVELEIVPGAGHLFEEPGTLETVAELAAGWFVRHLYDTTAGTVP